MTAMFMTFYFLNEVAKKFWFFFILYLSLTGCGFLTSTSSQSSTKPGEGALSSNILIAIAPIGERPLVFRSDKESALCRRGYPTHDYGLELEEIEEINSRRGDDDSGDDLESEEEIISKIFEDVGEGWFKIGLNFSNNSDYYLVVENLEFTISAPWGDELLSTTQSISGGYCESDPLYLVPPKSKVIYNPDRSHSMGNLQLYIDGLPIPTAPPVFKEKESESAATPPAELQNQPQHPDIFQLTYLPSYRVQLLIIGHFMNERRSYIGNFSRKLIFHTASRF